MPAKEVIYTTDNLKSFAQQLLLSDCPETAYRKVFGTRGKERNREAGTVLMRDGRVVAFMDLLRAEQVQTVREAMGPAAAAVGVGEQLALDTSPRAPRRSRKEQLEQMMEVVYNIAADATANDGTRLNAATRYDSLHRAWEELDRAEEIPEELAAFLDELKVAV